jgi:phosphotransferase family enzyme
MRAAVEELVATLLPGARVREVTALTPDTRGEGGTAKALGYGAPLRVTVTTAAGDTEILVFRTASADEFGHDRRSDRAQEMLLDYDTFNRIPRHVPALDVGAIAPGGRLVSLRDCGEFYLITRFAPGTVYAEDLRRIARGGLAAGDEARCDALADYLVALHEKRPDRYGTYRRTIRDLLGHGEGIFGMVDGYGADTPAASPARLHDIERHCLDWRWRLRDEGARLARIHGDFHPFNLLFREGADLTVLDTSRGSEGDPADDLTALAINFVFFSLEAPAPGRKALGTLWRRFFGRYLDATGDARALEVAPPFFAWRGLVVSSPRFYPSLPAEARDAMLGLVEWVLAEGRLDPALADELWA